MNEKSRFLDQLRFDVGRVPDRAHTLKDFYLGILNAIGKNLSKEFSIGLFLVKNNKFYLIGRIGQLLFLEKEKFGEGDLSICAIRGEASVFEYETNNILCCPFYNGHHLLGVFVICVHNTYKINEDDIIFLKELSRFIEQKRKDYYKKNDEFTWYCSQQWNNNSQLLVELTKE